VTPDERPVLDGRDAAALVAALLARRPAYAPDWAIGVSGPGRALAEIFGRQLQALVGRLEQAPEKAKLAFLDLLGISLLPAQPARAPVVFRALPNIGDTRVPERSRVGANVPGRDRPLVFETEQAIALAAARLAEVVALWPGRDAYADHGADAVAGRPFTLFEPLQPVPHELYLAHDALRLTGEATVELQFELPTPANSPLTIAWGIWDGENWRPFGASRAVDTKGQSFDGTNAFRRSGTIRLVTPCGAAERTTVDGIDGYWVRGRLVGPLVPTAGQQLPELGRVRLRAAIDRPLTHDASGQCLGLQADRGMADDQPVDLSGQFHPLGRAPGPGAAFYLASEEIFSKPGAKAAVCFRKVVTPEEKSDQILDAQHKLDVKAALKGLLDSARSAALAVAEAGTGVLSTTTDLPTYATPLQAAVVAQEAAAADPAASLADLASKAAAVAAALGTKAIVNQAVHDSIAALALANVLNDKLTIDAEDKSLQDVVASLVRLATTAREALRPLAKLGPIVPDDAFPPLLDAAAHLGKAAAVAGRGVLAVVTVLNLNQAYADPIADKVKILEDAAADPESAGIDGLVGKIKDLLEAFKGETAARAAALNGAQWLFGASGGNVASAVATLEPFVQAGAWACVAAASWARSAFGSLDQAIPPISAGPPKLPPPRLAWEYFDGSRWRPLFGPSGADAMNFLDSGELGFTVPGDLEPTTVADVTARWIRARLVSGSYDRLRMVTYKDPVSKSRTTFPMTEPRPPVLEGLVLGYAYQSPWTPPAECLTLNDFQYEDRGADVRRPTAPFPPFRPVADPTPALYLGFDAPLPADLIGLYVALAEAPDTPAGPPLVWEAWDGQRWLPPTVRDETRGLSQPGLVSVLWPGGPAPLAAPVAQARDSTVSLASPRDDALFAPGDPLYLASPDGRGERVTAAAVGDGTVTLTHPLARAYNRATLGSPGLPRFGTPRTWLRVRLKGDGEPPRPKVDGLYLNAVWASQVESFANEVLGSGDTQPGQALFFRQAPVLEGEVVEVRELDGERAAVELPMLLDDLRAQGLGEGDVRTVVDAATGRFGAVWVRWRNRPNLFFSGPRDRHYVLERSTGRLVVGDQRHGGTLPAGPDNVVARSYRSGGGVVGNVPAGAIGQVLAGVVAQSVTNPRAAEGGADGEPIAAVSDRGPLDLRHRLQAISAADYEALALEAASAVAVARALPATAANGRPAPGHVRLVIVPHGQEPRPTPSFELRRRVRTFLAARVPAAAVGGIAVVGPDYLPIGVAAALIPLDPAAGGVVKAAVLAALQDFLHPLRGGPEGRGWPFGRDVFQGDVAAALERVPGVDSVVTLDLLVDATPRGERVAVPPDRIVVAGPLIVTLAGEEA
jgi:hypothetical protein